MISYSDFIEKAEHVKCFVFGDLMLDKYIYGSVERISPEAPVPVVKIEKEAVVCGGAANVAANIQAMGVQVSISGRIGQDMNGTLLLDSMKDTGIDFKGIISDEAPTIAKTRIIGRNQQIVRIDQENIQEIKNKAVTELLRIMKKELRSCDVTVISDYGKGSCTGELCKCLIYEMHSLGKIVLVDTKEKDWTKYAGADLITPNFKEFKEAAGVECENCEDEICAYAVELCKKYSLGGILVTRSQYGMTYIGADGEFFTYDADAKEVYDVSGAGDTVIAITAAFLATKMPFIEAVYAANAAAGIAVSKLGTYHVSSVELFSLLGKKASKLNGRIWSLKEAVFQCRQWSSEGEKIIFTNGCFDILHRGHVWYLDQARKLGGRLVVGINTDRSVRRLKGDGRPVNRQGDRAFLISSLACVDGVVLFDEDTPYELIKSLCPDILVKGGDYKVEDVIGRELVDEVVIIPLAEGYSTTRIIEGMK